MATELEQNYADLKQRTPSALLWHYTDWEAFSSITEKEELWASDYRSMNDVKEMRHGLEVAKGMYPEAFGKLNDWIGRFLNDDTILSPADIPHIISLSRDFDSLSQWRAYSQTSVGVSLGFDTQRLTEVTALHGFQRLDCVYDVEDQRAMIKAQIAAYEVATEGLMERVQDESLSGSQRHLAGRSIRSRKEVEAEKLLTEIVPRFKDKAFKPEREVRLVSRRTDCGLPIHFRRKGGMIVPYFKVPLKVNDGKAHPLIAVLVGPTDEPNFTRSIAPTLQYRLGEKFPGLKLAVSQVPLRT